MRIAIAIEYDGSAFSGWQHQRDQRTVQAVVEQALSRVADQPVTVTATGRTDAGVHALELVAHFDTTVERGGDAWMMGGNSYLPDDVRIIWSRRVSDTFHARSSALARYYRYSILNRNVRSALLRQQITTCYTPLNVAAMQQAADYLVGEHDFSSFRAQGCQSKSPNRRMDRVRVTREGEQVHIDLVANAFLHHMVRNIAGALIAVGSGKQPPEWLHRLLLARDRKQGGVTAAPYGLYLMAVYYPQKFGIARHPIFDFLPDDLTRIDHRQIADR